ncbi:pilus assembly protein [bacterium]|nr:pilus assembly protein [bacterium]
MRGQMNNEKGQVAVLFALVFTFMFILFAFVVDFGHLINNKINLQIAADTAAYTGAAWQARTLNQIGKVNYHLRQDFKELAMRVNVSHVRHNREFPRGSAFINGGRKFPGHEAFVCQQAHGYRTRSGVAFKPDTNICANADPRIGGLPPIVVPPVIAAFDPFQVALNAQLNRIREIADTQCRAGADDNLALINHLGSVYQNRARFHANQIRELEAFLNEELINEQPSENVQHPLLKSVYETVRRNLSISNRANNFKIEVLPPNGNKYLELVQYEANGKLFYYDFNTAGSGCVAIPRRSQTIPIIAGFEKKQDIVTYFAVKVSATPRMLFMPQKWVEAAFPNLEAYAAAKPFGSRIGPQRTTDSLVPVPGRPDNVNTNINVSFFPNDDSGFLNTKTLALFDRFHPLNSANKPDGNQISGWPEPDRQNNRGVLQLVRAPSIFDSMFYTVFPDPGNNINDDYTEPNYALALYPDYTEAAGPDNAIINTPQPNTQFYFRNLSSNNRGPGWIQINADPGGGRDYGNYATEQLASHSTTGVSGIEIVKEDPNAFGFATKDQIHSGWAPNDQPGRIGYSVKFISFDLLKTLQQTNASGGGSVPIANKPQGEHVNNILH